MKIVIIFIFAFLFWVSGVFVKANTSESIVEKQMLELQACMQKFMHSQGTIPSGENASVVFKLKKYGFTVPIKYMASDGSYLDYWGTPFYFVATKEGNVIILSLGEKSGDNYPNPIVKIVKLTVDIPNHKSNYANDGTLNYFNIDQSLAFGSQNYIEAILSVIKKKGDRSKIVNYVFDRATELDIGVRIFFQEDMFITWLERNSDGNIVEKQIMIEFDSKRQPIRIATGFDVIGKWPRAETYIAPQG